MKDSRPESLESNASLWKQGEKRPSQFHDLYGDICDLDTLQTAYKETQADHFAVR